MNFMEQLPAWVTWVFSGIGVFVLSAIFWALKKYVFKSDETDSSVDINNSQNVTQNVNVTIAGNHAITSFINTSPNYQCKDVDIEELKVKTHILFVDDESFKIVKIIKNTEGWINTNWVKDVKSLTAPEVRRADIVFVDINGVGGSLFNEQGLGLAGGIKRKYPEKRVIIYSEESEHNVFSENWKIVDDRLPKNADPIEFITKIETFAAEIYNEKIGKK